MGPLLASNCTPFGAFTVTSVGVIGRMVKKGLICLDSSQAKSRAITSLQIELWAAFRNRGRGACVLVAVVLSRG
jgi:hypothetical protein